MSPLSRSARKLYQNTLTVDLDVDRLEYFLCYDLEIYSKDKRLCNLSKLSFTGIAQRIKANGLENRHEDLSNLSMVLESFLSSTLSLPAAVVYETHSYMGLIKTAQKNNQAAKMHFLKALWIVCSSSTEGQIPKEQLAVAMHRLARAYMTCKHYKEAVGILQKAIANYRIAGVAKEHSCVVDANKVFVEAQRAFAATPQPKAKKRLSFIDEESECSTQTGSERRGD
eukprot:CAMPEP_0172445780 /NCGR_PEP_ID=MMETSP1065-20121228/5576_1 /TAXON_ID=265537 /ORGANISM="Amphiprora paludosa, Strain CCMP125" /LENGTH=225 /DNA_ID=CAMNT_0013196761 /DNA_START=376 /DNA_END=1053 /DNA_ORIENTATION=+